jgi:thiamine biosynthesis lipoprotein
LRGALLAALSALACAASPPPPALVEVSDGRLAMGTLLEITLHAPAAAPARETLDALFGLAQELDAKLSRYQPESELSKLNRAAGRGPAPVGPELARILEASAAYAKLTRGAFDVTVGPLVVLWTRAGESGVPPSDAAIAQARALVGADQIRVEGSRAALARDGVSVDLGGIAKGWALDQMLPLLRERGIDRALLDFGQSSLWALGAPPGAAGWRLLARGPGDRPLGVLTLSDQALSVSGSLGQWVEIGGRRYGHVLDPRSGLPLERRRQALVVAPDAALAEALSKGLLILGEQEGIALVAAQTGCEGMLVDADGGRWETPGWREAVRFEAALEPPPAVEDQGLPGHEGAGAAGEEDRRAGHLVGRRDPV